MKLDRLREQARERPDRVFTALNHLIDLDFLMEAWSRTRKDAAAGVDDQTAAEYAENLIANLSDLLRRYKENTYRAPPVKRVWIEKEDKSLRPIGIPTLEDKILQRAVAMVISAIYEMDFYDFSYGFREKRSAHDALGALRESCFKAKVSVIIDADVSKFFDKMPHDKIREILRKRINDGKIIRFIGKWLNAGVLEKDSIHYPDCGSPQGGVISPLLANIFLHEVLDNWYVQQAKPRLKGRSFLIRYADDFVMGCENAEDGKRLMEVLPKRFEKYGLTIHPDKSKMIRFEKASRFSEISDNGTFDFLGFTHYWGRSRNNNWVVKRRTAKKRLKRAMRNIHVYCRNNKHEPISVQHAALRSILHGLYNYYGIPCNYEAIYALYRFTRTAWKRWLARRTRDGYIDWEKFIPFLNYWRLPMPKITKKGV
jgi:group II intron reverse transcriptase/maturase